MNLEQQRAIVAEWIMGYELRTCYVIQGFIENGQPAYSKRIPDEPDNVPGCWEFICFVPDYHPDLEDRDSLWQADVLLSVIVEGLDLRVAIFWLELECAWCCTIQGYTDAADNIHTKKVDVHSENKRWNAALLEAASKLAKELAKESK